MMQTHKHQEPSFQRLRRSISSRSPKESSDLAVHAFHHIRSRGKIQSGMPEIRTILIQAADDFSQTMPVGLRTQRMSDVSPHAAYQSLRENWIVRGNNFLHRLICSSSSASPSDAPLDAPQEHMEAGHEMEVASLQDPVVISSNMLNASNTIGNQGLYASVDIRRYGVHGSIPSLRRFPFLTHCGPQEHRILSIHASHSHQICRPSLALEAEPQSISDQEERTRWDTYRPWLAVQRDEGCGVSLAQSGNSPMSASCLTGQRLLLPHDMSNDGQSVLSRLLPSPFLPDCPSYSASDTASSMLAVSMNNRVRTPDFSVSCFHTQRIQDENKQTSTIFLA